MAETQDRRLLRTVASRVHAIRQWLTRHGAKLPYLSRQLLVVFSRRPLRRQLAAIVLTVALPLNVIVLAVIWSLVGAANDAQRASLHYTARSIAGALDAELGKYLALGEALARSPALLEADLKSFEAEARRSFAGVTGAWVLVASTDGQQLLNIGATSDATLPARHPAALTAQQQAFVTRAPVVTGIRIGPVINTWVTTIEIPVFRDGEPYRIIAVVMTMNGFYKLLSSGNIPPNWLAGIIDEQGRYIARVPDHERTVGAFASEGWRRSIGTSGISEFASREGDLIINANERSRLSGWTVGVGVKKAELQAAAWKATRQALIWGGAVSGLSLLLAGLLARRMSRNLEDLRRHTQALLGGRLLPSPEHGTPEIASVQEALQQAAEDRLTVEAELARKHEELRNIYKSAYVGLCVINRELRFERVNQRLAEMNGLPIEAHIGKAIRDVIPDLADQIEPLATRIFLTGEGVTNFKVSGSTSADPGTVRHWILQWLPLRDSDGGGVRGVNVVVEEVTERLRAEEQLRRSHETYVRLIQNAAFGVYLVDADFRLAEVSLGAQKVFETIKPSIGRDFAEVLRILWPEPFASEAIAIFRHTLATGEPFHSRETKEVRADTTEIEAYDWRVERVVLPTGSFGAVCYFYDLSERHRHEAHVKMLMHEQTHRIKNLISLIDAIARRTVAPSIDEFRKRFSKRLHAVAANQELLLTSEGKGVDFAAMAHGQLSAFTDPASLRVRLSGPPIVIHAAAAQAISMALHELMTNAAKYGALSREGGFIDLRWSIADGVLDVSWEEIGGPTVVPPERRGFGSTVTDQLVSTAVNGTVIQKFEPTGLLWCLKCPLKSIEMESSEARVEL